MTAQLVALAERAARAAGALLLDRATRSPEAVASKSSATDMVSAADRASEQLLEQLLLGERPQDGVVGEEGAARPGSSGIRWVVDPLDGTTNYLYRVPQWAVSVACEDAQGLLAACVYDPNRDEAFTAGRGLGARLDGVPISVGHLGDLEHALIGTGFAYRAERRRLQGAQLATVIGEVRDIRRAGSAALDLAWVACGRLDGFYETDIQHWDYAGGSLLVQEAGGRFRVAPGPVDGLPQAVAANEALFDRLAALVA
jgi:myo-inositol-1(or 4)-monophosphatase